MYCIVFQEHRGFLGGGDGVSVVSVVFFLGLHEVWGVDMNMNMDIYVGTA